MDRVVDGGVVTVALDIPGSADTLVLLNPEQRPPGVLPWHQFHNVVRVAPDGEILWRAELVPQETAAKCWLGIRLDGSLRVWTYSYVCELDLATGRIIGSTFTK